MTHLEGCERNPEWARSVYGDDTVPLLEFVELAEEEQCPLCRAHVQREALRLILSEATK